MTKLHCLKCGCPHLVKAGKNSVGNQKYKCKSCGSVGTFSNSMGCAERKNFHPCIKCGNPKVIAKGLCASCYNKERYYRLKKT